MKRAKAIMIQGTMSNAGKSLFAGALCRIFRQDGYSVCPFKSQNMALNSFVTRDGLEMGRAQVMQAEAAGIEPDVRMNPILLKPTDDIGSQVIVNGRIRGNMSAREYYKNKLSLVPDIMSAYNTLAEKYDIIVIEGAGSPAEINLKENDIVNMGMAKMAKAPVLLVGDIDRGGVFAQLLGTSILLDDKERAYIKGLVINKFRGDKSILKSGLDMLERRVGKPVVGVVPYINCDIDDEDSLTERFNAKQNRGLIDIAVIRLPKISNFTDFAPFECVDGVSLRYVSMAEELAFPDMVIIPGTKNTIADLIWLRENGIETKIKQLAAADVPVFGICGGYQMLGERITDSCGAEHYGSISGMGLLPIETVFESEKTKTRVSGIFKNAGGIFKFLNNIPFEGYEIHMGVSKLTGNLKNMGIICDISGNNKGKGDGASSNNIYGSYVHGIFDNAQVTQCIISALLAKKGLPNDCIGAVDMSEYKQRQYDILADAVRKNIDMEYIYKILNEGV